VEEVAVPDSEPSPFLCPDRSWIMIAVDPEVKPLVPSPSWWKSEFQAGPPSEPCISKLGKSWRAFYLQYRDLEEVGLAFKDGWHLLRKIEDMVAAGSFHTSTQPFDPAND
jgi:hypothetical protein